MQLLPDERQFSVQHSPPQAPLLQQMASQQPIGGGQSVQVSVAGVQVEVPPPQQAQSLLVWQG
jgi:hypothetical protein